ncbi:ABC transporter permease [Streptococcus gallolyticus]|uniref:Putative ABC transport system permease protein n=1 Tax=Streptococcus gallolyticus TaxID=315405 RepID=A0A1H9MHH2_9STRE|nr:ABC transporter permease [Streptococcus gallolyticus]SER23142.1 putative ABC transport system permease protein [Streptococcus gallolyticus]
MKYLNLKLRRDIKRHWQQFFSVFLMSLLSVLIFVGLQGAWHGLEKSLDDFISKSHLPTVWLQADAISKNQIEDVKALPSVDKVNAKTTLLAKVNLDSDSKKYINLNTFNDSSEKVITVDEGKKFDDNSEGIWLDTNFANKNHLKLGDELMLSLANRTFKFPIRGLVESADKIYFTGSIEYLAPNSKNYAYGYVSEKALAKVTGNQKVYNALEIYAKKDDFRKDVETILGGHLISYYNQETLTEVSEATGRVGQIRNLSYLFSFIFILLAVLAMFTTIRRLIESQTKEIAVIKALGYSNGQITWHYISFGLLVGSFGALVGAAVSPLMSLFVLETQKTMFTLPHWQIAYSWSALAVIVLVIFICTLSAYLASRQVIKGLPAIFLRGKTKKVHHVFLEKMPVLWYKISDETKWAIRDAFINKVRVLMGIVGVAGSMMLLIAGIGMPISMNHLVDKAYNNDFSYTKRLTVANYNLAEKSYKGQGVQITQAHFSKDDGYNRLLIIVSDGDYVNARTADDKKIGKGGIYVTNRFAELAGIKKGDTLKVKPYQDGKSYSFKVKGIVTSETNQGAYIRSETFEEAGGHFTPQTLLVGQEVSKADIKKDSNVLSVINKSDQEKNAYDFVNSLMSVFLMIVGFALLLVVVVLYNLGSLNFVERMRDYATLQVLGFSKQNLQIITMIENLMTTSIGWIIGIPMGIWFLKRYVATFSTIRIEYTAYVTWQVLLGASILVWLTSAITTIVISHKIKTINMVEALKGVE